jgi:hypothetical protein
MNKTLSIVIGVLALAVVVLAITGVFKGEDRQQTEAELIAFAECLQAEGATFYGAFWCPHCQNQKAMFGRRGSDALPYVECSTRDGQGQTQECIDAGVESYPTWEFADGTRVTGTQSIETLAQYTSCEITPGLMEFFNIQSNIDISVEENEEITEDETLENTTN